MFTNMWKERGEILMRWLVAFMVGFVTLFVFANAADTYANVAETYWKLFLEEEFSAAYDLHDATMKAVFTEDKMKQAYESLVAQYGAYVLTYGKETLTQGGYNVVVLKVKFERAYLNIVIPVNSEGKVSGLRFAPGKPPENEVPQYVNMDAFVEKEIEFSSEPWVLKGTITVPKGADSFPIVVFVHGSGPADRDETIGLNKPFRDLAWGLASMGIASLRYDKRTYTYGKRMQEEGIFPTIEQEVIEDACAAINTVRSLEEVTHVYLLGHSLGATLAPFIALSNFEELSGVIMLAPTPRKLAQVMKDQYLYILSLGQSEEVEKQILNAIEILDLVIERKLSPNGMALGVPASYFYELEKYNPIDYLREISLPVLILQGSKDYQVTVEKDFRVLENALSDKSNVEFKLFDGLNHFFMKVQKSTPADSMISNHVEEEVVFAIGQWIKRLEGQ